MFANISLWLLNGQILRTLQMGILECVTCSCKIQMPNFVQPTFECASASG